MILKLQALSGDSRWNTDCDSLTDALSGLDSKAQTQIVILKLYISDADSKF